MEQFDLTAALPHVTDIPTLKFFDHVVGALGPRVVVCFFYSRSCGTCKAIRTALKDIAVKEAYQGSGVVFLQHDVRSEFDELSDLARQYRIRHVPCFGFFVEGALVKKVHSWDVR